MTAPTSVRHVARGIAGWGLAGSTVELPTSPLDDASWGQLARIVKAERLTGLTVAAVAAGDLATTAAQAEHVGVDHRAAMVTTLTLERELVRAAALLTSAGFDFRVMKGPTIAHLDYPEPGLRPFGDVDLLVERGVVGEVTHTLAWHGFSVIHDRSPQHGDATSGPSLRSPAGAEIDIHHSFVVGPVPDFGPDLFGSPAVMRLGGRDVPVLDRPARFLNVCYEAALTRGPTRLGLLRDLAQIHLAHPLDADEVIELTHRCQAGAVVATAVMQTWDTLELGDITKLVSWARRYRPSPQELHVLAHAARPGHRDGEHPSSSRMWVPQWVKTSRRLVPTSRRGRRPPDPSVVG